MKGGFLPQQIFSSVNVIILKVVTGKITLRNGYFLAVGKLFKAYTTKYSCNAILLVRNGTTFLTEM